MAADEDDLRETIIETHRDVKWICRTLARWSTATPRPRSACGRLKTGGASGSAKSGGIVAVVAKVMGWG